MGQARELMDRTTQAILGGDLDALREICAPDMVVTTPDLGELHGVEAFIAWNRSFVDAFSDRSYEQNRGWETDDCAIDEGWFVGVHSAPLRGADGTEVAPTGRRLRLRAVDIATVVNGRISRHDFYFDQLDLLTQLGALEATTHTG